MTKIDVCIATFKRPELLKNLLESIEKQDSPEGVEVGVIVVDNDRNATAKEVVSKIAKDYRFPVQYDIEFEQNIALARNRAVSMSVADYVLFIDDDEFVTKEWVKEIYQCAKEYNAAVVFGPVRPIFSEDAEKWIIEAGFFSKNGRETGEIMQHGPTSNTLVKRKLFLKDDVMFNRDYGLTGGSDMELFWKLYNQGHKLIWCNEAFVYENVPDSRVSEEWLLKRSFRGGQTICRVFLSDTHICNKIKWYIFSFAQLVVSIILYLIYISISYKKAFIAKKKLVGNLGKLTGLTRWKYKEYKKD